MHWGTFDDTSYVCNIIDSIFSVPREYTTYVSTKLCNSHHAECHACGYKYPVQCTCI